MVVTNTNFKTLFNYTPFLHFGGILYQMIYVADNSISIIISILFNFYLIFNPTFYSVLCINTLFYCKNFSSVYILILLTHIFITGCCVVLLFHVYTAEPRKDLLNINKNSFQFNSVMGIECRGTHTHTQTLQQIGQI